MKLVLMTKPSFFVEEDKIIATLFYEGLDYLHLFKPMSAPIYSERLLTLLPEEYYRKISVHDHYYLKNEYGLYGIHIDDTDAPLPAGYKGKFSRTCMSLEKLKMAKKKAEYVFLRNIFQGLSNPEEKATFTQQQLKDAAADGLIDKHVYALGGMDIDTIKFAKDLGFGGVVICGDLWNRFDIHQQQDYKELIHHFERLKKLI